MRRLRAVIGWLLISIPFVMALITLALAYGLAVALTTLAAALLLAGLVILGAELTL